MPTENETMPAQPLEVLESNGALATIERASIDQQVATAHQFPRSIKQFMADAKDMVTLDLETAEGCFYRLERKSKDGTVKVIEGPSVRLLEIAASCYGNIRYGSRVIAIEDKFVVTQGVAHDLQRNVFSSSETRRRITTSSGYRFSDDMIGVTANAACSIAKRNALNGVVPRVYVNQLCEMAKETSRGTSKTLTDRRTRALAYFAQKLGVKPDKVLAKLGRTGIEEITLEDIDRLNGIKTAIKEGDSTVDEEFNPKPEGAGEKKPLGALIGAPKAGPEPASAPPEPEQAPVAPEVAPEAPVPAKATETAPAATAPKYTSEQRQAILREVESLMLTHEVGEAKVLRWATEHGLRKPEQDEISALDTAALDQLRAVIPTIKAKATP